MIEKKQNTDFTLVPNVEIKIESQTINVSEQVQLVDEEGRWLFDNPLRRRAHHQQREQGISRLAGRLF